ncbi:MAG TPA: Gfo/Idh/MocA family oxidoreductase [Lacunisphaera sp.]|nr:Gfo/Idh/MocA family oxidoreductase [Lacunisphaera sp.]
MSATIRWGVLGWARIARLNVIPAIQRSQNGRLHAVASRSEDKLAECRGQFNPPVLYRDYGELVRDPLIDAVYNPLPNSLHKEWTIRAAEQGKHVLCEKPAALNTAETREMIAACRANGVVFMEAFMYRYTARTARVVETLRSGVLGEIKFIQSQFRFLLNRPGDVRREPALGGGSLYDVGCYPVNFTGLVLDTVTGSAPGAGPRPESIQAHCVDINGVDELFSALLRYPGGVTAAIHSGLNAQFRMGAEIIGTKGALEVPFTFLGNAGPLTLTTGEQRQEIPVPESDRYQLQAEDFADAILTKRPPRLTPEETIRNMELIDRLYATARGART